MSPFGRSLVDRKKEWRQWWDDYSYEIVEAHKYFAPCTRPPAWFCFAADALPARRDGERVQAWLIRVGEIDEAEIERAERHYRQNARREAKKEARPPVATPRRIANPGVVAWRLDMRPGAIERRSLPSDN